MLFTRCLVLDLFEWQTKNYLMAFDELFSHVLLLPLLLEIERISESKFSFVTSNEVINATSIKNR